MSCTGALDYYRFASPRGIPLKQLVEWTTSAATDMVISPGTDDVYFVKSISFLIDQDADLGANSITITHNNDTFGGTESTTLTYTDVDELIAAFAPCSTTVLDCRIKGHIIFDVPVRLDDADGDTLTIAYSGGGGISAGQINIAASGWYIDDDADL